MKTEYEIEIVYKCNWNCEYCCVETHKQTPESDKGIYEKFLTYNLKDTSLTISGGEPSFASDTLLGQIIDYCILNNVILNLNTNGRFIEKKGYALPFFKEINYHCSEDLYPKEIKEYNLNSITLNYLIILTDNNVYRLDGFIKANEKFFEKNLLTIIPASNPYGVNNVQLSLENYSVYKKYTKYMTKESKLRFLTKNKSFKESEIIYITNRKSKELI